MSVITKRTRMKVYKQMFKFMIEMNTHILPTPLENICKQNNFELTPLSRIKEETKLTEREVFDLWGNEDGATMTLKDKHGILRIKIMYNDNSNHVDRSKFTIAEEISHCVLGHIKNPTYCLDGDRDNYIYAEHEECARIAAGLLICPPPVFYEYPHLLKTEKIKYFCGVSESCANVRSAILEQYREEIQSCMLYNDLSQCYDSFMDSIPCERCGDSPIVRDEGICKSCYYELTSDFYSVYA